MSDFQDMTIVFNDIDVLPYTKELSVLRQHRRGESISTVQSILGGLVSFAERVSKNKRISSFFMLMVTGLSFKRAALDASLAIDRERFSMQ
jgi:hypothetical protein